MTGDDGISLLSGLDVLQPVEKPAPIADRNGIVAADDLHIYLKESVLRDVVEWSRSDLERELGGVFVGDVYSADGRPYVEVAGYIRARRYEHTAASFRFTHDTWSGISRERDRAFGGRVVVGWHHTHPGYGVFLSGIDAFSHRSFFNLPWMFAMVVDPRREELGFFQWKGGRIAPCGFFFLR